MTPALELSSTSPVIALREGGRGGTGVVGGRRALLVVGESAIAVVLIIGDADRGGDGGVVHPGAKGHAHRADDGARQ
jgi:hypothetical protein